MKTLNNARKNASGSGIFPLAFFFESVQQFVFCNRQVAVGQAVDTGFATGVLRLFVWYFQATLQVRRVFVKTLNNARKNASGSGIFPLAFFESVQQFVFCNRQVAVGQVFLKNNQNKNTRKFRVRFFVVKCVSLHKFVQPYVKKRCYLTYQLS